MLLTALDSLGLAALHMHSSPLLEPSLPYRAQNSTSLGAQCHSDAMMMPAHSVICLNRDERAVQQMWRRVL
jgi:hypothetical protein